MTIHTAALIFIGVVSSIGLYHAYAGVKLIRHMQDEKPLDPDYCDCTGKNHNPACR